MSIKIFIPSTEVNDENRRTLFTLTRPFLTSDYQWTTDEQTLKRWGVSGADYELILNINEADLVLIPSPINDYFIKGKFLELEEISKICQKFNINAFGYISGDFGERFKEFPAITYLRMGGFKSQLNEKNKGFPVLVSDKLNIKEFLPSAKSEFPTVGFCGHASFSNKKILLESAKFFKENSRRFLRNPFRKDYEILFTSAFQRAQLLQSLEKTNLICTNFIYRKQYRAGAKRISDREKTTLDYFDNIRSSNYVICIRGAGNFSVRLYETLMMGKIPIFVNTDCLLPFKEYIDWKSHVVWVEWKDRKKIGEIVSHFHAKITNDEYLNLQIKNRKLWKDKLSINGMLKMISNDI